MCYLLLVRGRSQTDVDKASVTEGGEGKKERSVLHSKSIHTSLESLQGTRPLAHTDQTLMFRLDRDGNLKLEYHNT